MLQEVGDKQELDLSLTCSAAGSLLRFLMHDAAAMYFATFVKKNTQKRPRFARDVQRVLKRVLKRVQ